MSYDLRVDGETVVVAQSGSVGQYIHSALTPGTWHNYSVRAWNAEGAGDWSGVTVLETTAGLPGPSAGSGRARAPRSAA